VAFSISTIPNENEKHFIKEIPQVIAFFKGG
jgi:hypothetical protein